MFRVAMLIALVFVFAVGCGDNEPGPEDATRFTLTGTLQHVDREAKADASDAGFLLIESDEPVEGCTTPPGGYHVLYDRDTVFDPADATDDEDFPDNLDGQTVEVDGSHTGGEDGGCVLAADSVTIAEAAATPEE